MTFQPKYYAVLIKDSGCEADGDDPAIPPAADINKWEEENDIISRLAAGNEIIAYAALTREEVLAHFNIPEDKV